MGETDPLPADRHDSPSFQRLPVLLKHFSHQGNTLRCRYVWKAHQPCMWNILHVHKLSEVSVDRYQNSVFGRSVFEKCSISRIGTERAGFDNVVPPVTQPVRETTTSAPVNKKSHESATDTADRVSLAMTACA